ncbi:hypothetical protein RhiirA4_549281 [Rhizophagus irregularis]|uniref:Uncharacterized protein n=1 Tax=Rhizophagus irregularis TaxID=588596 RepID=A0A2I1HCC7_9GLOM|nr:hypothetical protein RhiirA4_549281 [Rhizophagus irregularis]
MQHTTMNWAFGYKFGCLESEETPHIIRYCVSFPSNISLINRLHIESNRKFMNVIEEFDGFIFDIIEIREIKLRKIPIKVMIYLELGINTDVKQLRDEMVNIFVAATSMSLSISLYYLAKYPDVIVIELKALTELRDVDKSSLMTLQIREVAKINEYEVKQLQEFYLHGGEGSRKITALAEAELEYRDDYQNKSQTYWNNLYTPKQCRVIDASHITEESGTGHGIEDYEACKNALLQKGINILMIGEQKAKSYTSMEWFSNVEATKQQAMKLFENVKWHLNLVYNKVFLPLIECMTNFFYC